MGRGLNVSLRIRSHFGANAVTSQGGYIVKLSGRGNRLPSV